MRRKFVGVLGGIQNLLEEIEYNRLLDLEQAFCDAIETKGDMSQIPDNKDSFNRRLLRCDDIDSQMGRNPSEWNTYTIELQD